MGPQGGDYTAILAPTRDYARVASWSDSPRARASARTRAIGEGRPRIHAYIYYVALGAGDRRPVSLTRYYCSDTTRHGVSRDLPWGRRSRARARARYHIQCRYQLSHHRRNRGSHGNRLGGALWCVKLKDSLLCVPQLRSDPLGRRARVCVCYPRMDLHLAVPAHAPARCPITPIQRRRAMP